MLEIDIRDWDRDLIKKLTNVALAGGATLRVDDNLRVIVLDGDLWDALRDRLPGLSETLDNIRALSKGD